jgi:TRAP-type C4-dicarboxylate transport system permease small subunit
MDGDSTLALASRLQRLTMHVAMAGGLLALALALLVVISVLGRWIMNWPVPGDFELVRMGTAVAVFAFLPYAQARRANIMVDTFSQRWPEPLRRAVDAGWDLAFAGIMALCAHGLFTGAREAFANGETTMMLQLAVWPAIGVSALLSALLVLTALATAWRLVGARR